MLPKKKIGCLSAVFALLAMPAWSQHVDRIERARAQAMLQDISADIKKDYYDPKIGGLDWDARVKKAKEQIASATDSAYLFVPIVGLLEGLDDSHTFFIPPRNTIRVEYGWRFEMIGTHCFVTHVQPGSDAEAKGLKPGDEVLTIDGFAPTRESLSKMEYDLDVLLPEPGLRVVLRDRSDMIRQVDVLAKLWHTKTLFHSDDLTGVDADVVRHELESEDHLLQPQYKEFGDNLLIVKLPQFSQDDPETREIISKAREHHCLILDLRGNPGGDESSFKKLLGGFFPNEITVATRVSRGASTPLKVKGSGKGAYPGKLIVLVDDDSASAAELFARVIQIEKRGMVLGDRTSGSVMEAKLYIHTVGVAPIFIFGASVTAADLVMSDGKSLEHSGVTPDEMILPTAADLAYGRDPVMSRAAAMAGVALSPGDAGELFPYEWPASNDQF